MVQINISNKYSVCSEIPLECSFGEHIWNITSRRALQGLNTNRMMLKLY